MNFLHNFHPNSIIFQVGFISVRWYGFFIAIALGLCLILAIYLAKKKNINSDSIYDLAFWLAVSGIIGARLYEVFIINWSYYSGDLLAIIKIWQGGLAIHGGIIGGVIALVIWTRVHKKDFWQFADITAVVLPLGQAIGRWGNYFNGELFGCPTNSIIGIPIDEANRPAEFISSQYFHPAFLYESILNLFLFLFLFFAYKKLQLKKGSVVLLYLVGYSLIRFIMEFIRIDPTPVFMSLRLPQIASIIIVLLVAIIFVKRKATDISVK